MAVPMDLQLVKEKLDSEEYKLIANPSRTKSDVWDAFGVVVVTLTQQEVGFVACKKCHHVLKMKQGNGTSTMMRHRKKCEEMSPETRRVPPQPHARADFKKACVQYCAKDMRPFSSLEGEGMKGLLQKAVDIGAAHALSGAGTVNVEDLVPDRRTLTDEIKAEAKTCRQELASKIKEAINREGCAVTTDLWTDNHRKFHYLTLTTHFINDDWELKSYPLITTHFDEQETGENIRKFITETMEREFGITQEELEKLTFVTDNGSNVQKALEAFRRFYCLAHALNICVRSALSLKYGDLVERSLNSDSKAKMIVEASEATVRLVKDAKNKQPADAKLKKKLCLPKKHVSSYTKMLFSLKVNFEEVKQFLTERERSSILTGVDSSAIEELIDFLDLLDFDGSRETSTTVTVSQWDKVLREEYSAKEGDSEMTSNMKSTVREELQILELLDPIEKCKALVAFFKRTGLNGKLSKSLKQEMEVRWNSILTLIQSIDDVWDEIMPLLQEFSDVSRMEGISRDVIKRLILFLTPFQEESIKLQGENYPTSQLAVLSFTRLRKHCNVPVVCGSEEAEKNAFALLRRNAAALLQEKVKLEMEHKVATFLSPKFRKLIMLTEESRKEVLEYIRTNIAASQGGAVEEEGPTPPKQSRLDCDYEDYACEPEISSNSMDEVDRYMSTTGGVASVSSETLLHWWKTEGVIFPALRELAKKALAIPATSAASERVFSKAGYILNERRSRLSPSTVDSIIFLNRYQR